MCPFLSAAKNKLILILSSQCYVVIANSSISRNPKSSEKCLSCWPFHLHERQRPIPRNLPRHSFVRTSIRTCQKNKTKTTTATTAAAAAQRKNLKSATSRLGGESWNNNTSNNIDNNNNNDNIIIIDNNNYNNITTTTNRDEKTRLLEISWGDP